MMPPKDDPGYQAWLDRTHARLDSLGDKSAALFLAAPAEYVRKANPPSVLHLFVGKECHLCEEELLINSRAITEAERQSREKEADAVLFFVCPKCLEFVQENNEQAAASELAFLLDHEVHKARQAATKANDN